MIGQALREVLEELGSVLVAYSGGVDSAYLAWAAHEVLGPASLAAIADSPSLPRSELADAIALAEQAGFPLEVVRTVEFTSESYLRNSPDRCFHCKEALFDEVFPLAAGRGLDYVALGTVTDDLGDVRPGLASAKARGARAPLLEAGMSKQDVRAAARAAGLRVWDKPQAACLSSRIPHGTRVSVEALRRVEGAEAAVRSLGFELVRVRHHGEAARVEVAQDELARATSVPMRDRIAGAVAEHGYREVTFAGYRRGGASLPLLDNPDGRRATHRESNEQGCSAQRNEERA